MGETGRDPVGVWWFRRLLHLYPRAFRERYEAELTNCFLRDRSRPRFQGLGDHAERREGCVARWVLGRSVVLTALGIAGGLAGAIATGRLMEGLLFGVESNDPVTLSAVPLVLGAVGLVASFLPARRASRLDPIVVLRQE